MDIQKLFVNKDDTVLNTMKVLDETGKRIVLIIEETRLLGVVTDGDIRRYILKSGNLNNEVSEIMNTNPITLYSNELHKAKEVFHNKLVTAIPIINDKQDIIDILFWDDVFGNSNIINDALDVPIVIMAGGKGTRLYPYTKILPKPLIPIGDTPIIERIINRFHMRGCNDFYITVNYKKNMIKAYFNELNPPYNISFIEESKPLGTGGSLHLLKNKINKTFIVSNCDILIKGNYSKMLKYHRKRNNLITIITSLKNHIIPYGVINLDKSEKVSNLVEKPEYNVLVNTGMYIIEPEVMADIPENTFYHITDLISKYINTDKPVGTYPISENSWLDMGQFNEMERMVERLGIGE